MDSRVFPWTIEETGERVNLIPSSESRPRDLAAQPSWRLIPSTCVPTPGQMAYDEELFKRFKPGDLPILRFFFFNQPTLTLGRLEAKRLDLSNLPYPYEIRPTGGRAVLHGPGDLCYSIVASTNDPLVGGELLESYRKISGLLSYALRGLDREVRLSQERHPGLETGHCFSSPSFAELILNGKKVAGGAQAREGGVFLQQGVVLLSVAEGWKSLFQGESTGAMTGLNEGQPPPPLSRVDVERAITAAFEETGVLFEKHFAPV
jgi:lipoate-protein ligase A